MNIFNKKIIMRPIRTWLFLSIFMSFLHPLKAADLNENAGLTFADAGRLAISASEELKNKYRRHFLQEGAWAWGLRAYFPQFTFSISEDDRVSRIGSDTFTKNYSVGAEQLLWDGGRLSLSRKLERAELDLGMDSLERRAQDIAENAVSIYRQLLFYKMLLEIRTNALESLQEQYGILKKEVELGLAIPIDLTGAELTIASAKIELLSLKLDIEEAEVKFTEILGLEKIPALIEKIDTDRSFIPVNPGMARSLAEAMNPDLRAAKLSVARRQAEAKSASLSWMPVIKLTGNFGLSGRHYPLTKYNWSVGLSIEFSSPLISGRINDLTGREPPNEKNARAQGSFSPLQNPTEAYSARNAMLILALEKSNYDLSVKRIGRYAEQCVEKCSLLEQKRLLALEALKLEGDKFRLAEVKLEIGRLTRVQLMEARLDYAAKEAEALEAVMALLEAERELERLLNLNPGELSTLRSVI